MKKQLTVIIVTFLAFQSFCATWTFHAWKDNFTYIELESPVGSDPLVWYEFWWDWTWDQFHPEQADSHMDWGFYSPSTNEEGLTNLWEYRDVWSVEAPSDWRVSYFQISGPADDYANFTDVWMDEPPGNGLFPGPNEYWIDWDSLGNYRVSTTQPADFGKWAWDGSINPSWVEPVTPLQRGKHLALGHGK